MKNLILFIILFFGCKTSKLNTKNEDGFKIESVACRITNIDSIESYYIVYAETLIDHIGHKIISKKEIKSSNVENIKVNNTYKFKLVWVSEPPPLERKGNYLDFRRCKIYFPLVKICTEPGYELYETDDLKGLKYKNL
ncbi:hypothetical protein [Flavobacterium sp.]|uniref:hypothetical protein n=1 Tax=Flavobacterium sp. TaxID=239 RepID=UPI0037530A21